MTTGIQKQSKSFSIPSVLAVIAAILSFTNGAVLGMVLAVAAIVFGLLGIALAVSPRSRGGITSTFAVIAGAFGVVAAVIKAILWFF